MTSVFLLFLFLPYLHAGQVVQAPGMYPVEETKQETPTVAKNPYQSMGNTDMSDAPEAFLFYYEKEPAKGGRYAFYSNPVLNNAVTKLELHGQLEAGELFTHDAPSAPAPSPTPIIPSSGELSPVHRPATPDFSQSSTNPGTRDLPTLQVGPDDPRYGKLKPKPQRIQTERWDDAQQTKQPIMPEIEVVPAAGIVNEKPDSAPELYYEKESGYEGPTPPTFDPYSETGKGPNSGSELGSGGPAGNVGKPGDPRKGAPGASPDNGSTAEFPDPEALTRSLGKASSWETYSSQEKGSSSSGPSAIIPMGSMKMTISKGGREPPADVSGEERKEGTLFSSSHKSPPPFDPEISVSSSRGKKTRFGSNESFASRKGNPGPSNSGDAWKTIGRTSSFSDERRHRIDSASDMESGSTFTNPSKPSAVRTSGSMSGSSSNNFGTETVLGQVTLPPESNPSRTYDSRLQPSSNKKNCCACCRDDDRGKTYSPYEKAERTGSGERNDFGKPYPIVREGDGYRETVHVAEITRPYAPTQVVQAGAHNYVQPKSSSHYREPSQEVSRPVETAYPAPAYRTGSQTQVIPAPISDADVVATPGTGSTYSTGSLSSPPIQGTGFNPVPIGTAGTVAAPSNLGLVAQYAPVGSYASPAQAYTPAGSCGCAQPVVQQTCCQPVMPCCLPTIPCCPPRPPIPCCPTLSLCCQPQSCCPPPPTCCQQAAVPQCYRACPSCPCRRRMHMALRMKRSPGQQGSCSACSASGQHMPGRRKRQAAGCKSCSQNANPLMGFMNHGGSCGTCNQSHKRTKRFGCLPCLGKRKKREVDEEEHHRRVKRLGCLPCLGRKKRSPTNSNCHSCSNLGHLLTRFKRTICSPCGRKKRDEEAVRRAPCPCAQNRSVAPPQSHLVNPLTAVARGKRAIDAGYDSIFTCDQSCCDYSKCNKLRAKRLDLKNLMK